MPGRVAIDTDQSVKAISDKHWTEWELWRAEMGQRGELDRVAGRQIGSRHGDPQGVHYRVEREPDGMVRGGEHREVRRSVGSGVTSDGPHGVRYTEGPST